MVHIIDVVQQADAAQLESIAALESQLFGDAWAAAQIGESLTQFGAGVLIAYDGSVLVGYCIYQIVFEIAEIHRIATAKTHTRQGIAAALIQTLSEKAAKQGAQSLLLEVREDNLPAIRLYQKTGFVLIDRRKDYYKADAKTHTGAVDALILQRIL